MIDIQKLADYLGLTVDELERWELAKMIFRRIMGILEKCTIRTS